MNREELAARVGRNPRTGETIRISPRRVPVFAPGKTLRERTSGLGEPEMVSAEPERERTEER